ncbi:hypothetical protein G6F56_009239 [Rhizopus delemar]|nr:hypothetical protein G6F56_009239 [Rhizopus delemar]
MSERRTPSPRDHKRSDRHYSDRHYSDRHYSDRHRSDRYHSDRHHSDRHRHRSPERRRERSNSRDRKRYRHGPEPLNGIPILAGESLTEYRTRVRNLSTLTVWGKSPERPRSVSPEEKRHKRDNSEEHKRRHKKHNRHHSSHKKRSSKKRKRYSSSEEESEQSKSDSESEQEKSVERKQVVERIVEPAENMEELWVEKQVDLPEDLAPVGPVPLVENDTHNERQYGSALLPGEGSAMAAYVQQGKRIPRRGEIGLSGDQISDFEKAGFVMSGSRHQRMNAVRLRKENQVISAEEKRLVLQHAQEQKLRRENEIISGFREILSDKFKKEDE